MIEIDVLRQLEAEGYFERARGGNHRACGLFARLAAYTLNPGADPASWGCLRKTAGGQNVEGYAEDAIVLGNDPNNLHNVVDIIGGAGAAGASVGWGGFVNRRPSDVWEAPIPLNAEQLAYLRPSVPVEPTPPQPAVVCRFDPIPIEVLHERMDALEQRLEQAVDGTRRAEAQAADCAARIAVMTFVGTLRLPSWLGGAVRITLSQPTPEE